MNPAPFAQAVESIAERLSAALDSPLPDRVGLLRYRAIYGEDEDSGDCGEMQWSHALAAAATFAVYEQTGIPFRVYVKRELETEWRPLPEGA